MYYLKFVFMIVFKFGGRLLCYFFLMKLDSFGYYMWIMFLSYDFLDVFIIDFNKGFLGKYELMVNGVDIVVMEVGLGYIDGDVIVYVFDEGLVYVGDILFIGGILVMWSGLVENLVKVLEILCSLNVKIIVLGYGFMVSD